MPKAVDVLVKEIFRDDNGRATRTGEPTTISYKSFLILNGDEQPRFELLGEVESVDKYGNVKLREGSPNLEAQHRQTLISQTSVNPAVNSGPTEKELAQQKEIDQLKSMLLSQTHTPLKEKRKPGPKKKADKETEKVETGAAAAL